ncbi:flagellar basal body rod protein FlgB [Aquabacterium sp.]|uniref:flagellar basal body rod protein FlgB n=1 Tax=Aquabacterium sp. TaxID=1872578 RepID=UPI002B5D79B5|nr:flagellar basal body protein [Aquabacterium sp.]HSW06357.1 flagellar basal body protein [Aquabacterium sp.]
MQIIDPATLDLVSRALSAATMRHGVHASNIANTNVEGFQPARVRFEEQLSHVRESLVRGEPLKLSDLHAVEASLDTTPTASKIELDSEVAAMSANGLHYQALLKALDKQLGLMSLAISDGRR